MLVPFHVGEDRSRTFVVTLVGDRLRLKHDHRHEDGTSDVLTMYGGESTEAGTATRQEFPVDEESKALFTREKREASNTNTWAMELAPRTDVRVRTHPPGRPQVPGRVRPDEGRAGAAGAVGRWSPDPLAECLFEGADQFGRRRCNGLPGSDRPVSADCISLIRCA